ncbi:MAG: IS1096 element passenger TnpR family protein [Terriglobia bacterium]
MTRATLFVAMSNAAASTEIYQFRVVVRDTSPHLWRRLRVRSSTTLAGFHHTLQVAFGWSGSRPYRFLIRGKALGINSPGGQN